MNNYRSRLIALYEAQTQKGIDKYGTVLEQNTDDVFKRLEHFRQEMLDGLNYSFWLEDELRKLGLGKSEPMQTVIAKGCGNCAYYSHIIHGNKWCCFTMEKQRFCKASDYCFWEKDSPKKTSKPDNKGLLRGCFTCGNRNNRFRDGCSLSYGEAAECRGENLKHYVSEDALLDISGPEVTE